MTRGKNSYQKPIKASTLMHRVLLESLQDANTVKHEPTVAAVCSSIAHPKNNLDRLMYFLHKNREIDGCTFEKIMPHLAQMVKENALLAFFVPGVLLVCYTNQFPFTTLCDKEAVHRHLWVRLKQKALKAVPRYGQVLKKKELKRLNQIARDFLNKDIVNDYLSFYGMEVKCAVDGMCEAFDNLVGEKLGVCMKGRFLEHCPIYRLPPEELQEIVRGVIDEIKEGIRFNHESAVLYHLQKAVNELLGNLYEPTKRVIRSCLVCGKDVKDDINSCKLCRAVIYCGEECQSMDWERHHRKSCSSLSARFELLEESIQVIEQNSHGPLLGSHKVLDYNCLYSLIGFERFAPPGHLKGLKGPSFKIFYENLARVRTGNFWIIDDADSMEKYMKELGRPGSKTELDNRSYYESHMLQKIVYMLSFDFIAFVKARHSTKGQAEVGKIASRLATGGSRIEFKMPSKRFLHLYQNDNFSLYQSTTKGPVWKSRRRYFIQCAIYNILAVHNNKDPHSDESDNSRSDDRDISFYDSVFLPSETLAASLDDDDDDDDDMEQVD